MHRVSISLVSTVLNDKDGAEHLLKDLRNQSRIPDEFVILDGGSTDGTFELLQNAAREQPYNLRVLQERGANVSRGRNLAIENARHDIVLTTDFGCRLHRNWIKELVTPFEDNPAVEIVTGSWKIRDDDIRTPVQWAEWALAGGRIGLTATPTCLASTRSLAFRRRAWLDFGRYPEDLTLAGDDAIFSLWMVAAKRNIAAAPEAICYWHRFQNLWSYFKEARRNFRGAGEAMVFLSYGVCVGFTFVLELASAAAVVLLIVAAFLGVATWVAVSFTATVAVLFWLRRITRWIRSARLLASVGRSHYWPWVIALESGTRWNSLLGYCQGLIGGFRKARDCRRRLKTLGVSRW